MIEIQNLSFSYDKRSPYLLKDISLHIPSGSYVSILGENGSAKSTLLKLLLNILKPSKGMIKINTQKIGYVPQRMESFNAQFPMTVFELLQTHAKVAKIRDKAAISQCLEKVSMEPFAGTLIGNLSGGQQQRIFIARALMGNPDLLVLDEPSTGIDIQTQEDIYGILKKLNVNLGITVVSVEHNLKAALANSSAIYHLSEGKGTWYSTQEFSDIMRNNETNSK